MQPKSADTPNWPIIDNVIGPLADWWRRHASVRENLRSLDAFDPEEMARVAKDVGVSPADLRALAGRCFGGRKPSGTAARGSRAECIENRPGNARATA
jgi:hypothetical protein